MTRKLKITPVLISINILVILVIISFYMVRMYKYYKLENTSSDENTKVTLYDEILKHQSLVDQTKRLVYDEKNNIYRYIGNIDDNYIKYNGILFILNVPNDAVTVSFTNSPFKVVTFLFLSTTYLFKIKELSTLSIVLVVL